MLTIINFGRMHVNGTNVELMNWPSIAVKVWQTSHRARISLLEEQLNQASDDKIKRMRQSQIASAEADYARRIQDLDIAMERAEITARPVAYGVINIDRGNTDAK